ncbi:hypothetical protein B0T11DRAFT_237061 [Plectosphaerella cucumerina]|uniref:Extracellular serine-rich protein n=1 Tax=Plectosphaerella cucumerina TaxID=40658 RepID=A0A8K0TFW1_9PEZI|nr:hypothetical protein B0T11DRAFT_237061 [Plectosphaerella cucumerina]
MHSSIFISLLSMLGSVAAAPAPAPQANTAPTTPKITQIENKVLVIARDIDGANAASAGLQGYGIPWDNFLVPKEGATLPVLNSTATTGRYSAIIVIDALAYEYADGWRSAVTDAQWNTLWSYQTSFRVRMVRINEFPGPAFGSTVAGAGGCCDTGVEQLISFTNSTGFPTANLKLNAGITSQGLWHYPAKITDPSTTFEVAKFGAGGGYGASTAAVINQFPDGREQFVWFTSWAPSWSATSNYLQHAHIHWITRGVFLGKRKTHLSAQVDDVQLPTDLYSPAGSSFKTRVADLNGHVSWMADLNKRLPAGSNFKLELAHNGNGDIYAATSEANTACTPDYHVQPADEPGTELEFQKPLGTGVDRWPAEFNASYPWSVQCAQRDDFAKWFMTPSNANNFFHLSHTFSHMSLNNATYNDAKKEIEFNQAWMAQVGIAKQTSVFSPKALVPPAITGLHNGDVIRAWMDSGLTNVVGDNTRAPLKNREGNKYWPLTTTVESNGYDGLTVIPRYATTIYYNCDTPDCTTKEWIETSAGKGGFSDLLNLARADNTRYLFALQSDPYMFHQANMRQSDMPTSTIGTQTGKMSLIMSWTETVAQEMTRLTNWPIISLRQDDIAQYFLNRRTLDNCKPSMSYGFSDDGSSITSVTVGAGTDNKCDVPVPVTIPKGTIAADGATVKVDQVGSEPPIHWVSLTGSPITFTLSSAVKL